MKIKSLEITGFKSFYEKTRIRFDKELNAIVGPNGCGKSNIIDAIRWILGEQNPRQMRANVMEEIISNGSEFLKPLGMAEVALVMENVPNYNFEEVEIKRRVFRSGDTEYYLNGVQCRLKDITDIFIDTGSGARAYSVISQGRVDQMITAKPEEKRTLIEEVAGIRRYKLRRRETESRIKTTRENLSRVKDMTNEVKRQMDTLSLQAEQAQEFRELSEEARSLESRIHKAKLHKLQSKKQKIVLEKTENDRAISKSEEEILQIVNHLKKLNNDATVSEEKISGLEGEIYRTRTELNSKISSQELIKSEITSIDRFIEKIESESVLLTRERESLKEQTALKNETLKEVREELETERGRIQERQNTLSTLKAGFDEIRSEHQAVRTALFKTLDEYSSLKGAALGYEKELKELYLKKEAIEKEIAEFELERRNTNEEVSGREHNLKEIGDKKNDISSAKNQLIVTLTALNEEQKSKLDESDSLNERLKESASRLNALNQIQINYEWLPEGIRDFILEHKGNGVLGTVSDFISVAEGYEKAVEAVLGEKIKWIVVEAEREALTAIDSLRQRSLGRGTFMPATNLNTSPTAGGNGVGSRPLTEIVSIEDDKLKPIENMLRSVFLVSTLEEGLELRRGTGETASFVTVEGDYIHSNGAISGGTAQPGILERKAEIEHLSTEVEVLQKEVEDMTSVIEANELRIRELKSSIKERENELIELDIREAETRKDVLNLKSNLEKLDRRIDIINQTLKETDTETDRKIILIDETRAAIQKLDTEKSTLEARFGNIEDKIQKAEGEERSIEREISEMNIKCASLLEKEKGLLEDLADLEKRIEDINRRLLRESENIEEKKQEKINFIEKDKDTVQIIGDINKTLSQNEEKLSLMRVERSRLLEEIRTTNESKENVNARLSELRIKNNSLELDLNGLQIEIENINDSLRRGHLTETAEETSAEPMEEETAPEINLSEEEPRLRRLQAKIEKFGPVNLLAPEEYNKLEERYNFLNEQTEDLLQALSSLSKAINKIDKESEKRFLETFEIMDKKFQEIFNRLFRGGEGKLVLTEPDNLLETGVEVMVRPRGKKFQSINLLSGGEKALSAIALIISACLIKPAPFLLFDEIDAPLDDRNTSYFLELVKEIDNRSQVILITHNKRTMQEMNSLIGITSNKSGTSTVVSVDLN